MRIRCQVSVYRIRKLETPYLLNKRFMPPLECLVSFQQGLPNLYLHQCQKAKKGGARQQVWVFSEHLYIPALTISLRSASAQARETSQSRLPQQHTTSTRPASSEVWNSAEERSESVRERSAIVPFARKMLDVRGETGGGVRGEPGDTGGDGDADDILMVAIVAGMRD
jgi:hypothetical protein